MVQLDGVGALPAVDGSALTGITTTVTTDGTTITGDGNATALAVNETALTIANTQVTGLGTSSTLNVGTGANEIVRLDGAGALPAVDGSALTGITTTVITDGTTITGDGSGTTLSVGNINANQASYTNGTSGLAATDVQDAIDEVESRVDTNEGNVSTNTGNIAVNASDIATNAGNIASLGTTVSTNTTNIGNLETLTGAGGTTNLGTVFTGTTIADNTTISGALQDLETAVEGVTTPNAGAIISTATGDIAATNVDAAIAELESEKLSLAGGTMTGALNMGANNINTTGVITGDGSGLTNLPTELPATASTGQILQWNGAAWVADTDDVGVSDLTTFDTDDLTEGATNLYFTNARVGTYLGTANVTSFSDVSNAGSGQIITGAERTSLTNSATTLTTIASGAGTLNTVTNPVDWSQLKSVPTDFSDGVDDVGLATTLTSASIFVGNGSNIATGVAMSGDVTIDNAGVTTLGIGTVGTGQIIDDNVTLTKLANGTANQVLITNGTGDPGYIDQNTFTAGSAANLVAGVSVVSDLEVDDNITINTQDTQFTLQDDLDNTKTGVFDLSGLTTATNQIYTLPDASGTIALVGGVVTDAEVPDNITINTQDTQFTLQDNLDNTKTGVFDLSGLTTATNQIYTLPDASGTIALTSSAVADLAASGSVVSDLEVDDNITINTQDTQFTLQDNLDNTKTAVFDLSGLTTATNQIYTLPDASGTIALVGGVVTDAEVPDNITINTQDTQFTLQDNLDNTKTGVFDLSGLTTATNQIYTLPDASGTIALTTDVPDLSAATSQLGIGTGSPGAALQIGDGFVLDNFQNAVDVNPDVNGSIIGGDFSIDKTSTTDNLLFRNTAGDAASFIFFENGSIRFLRTGSGAASSEIELDTQVESPLELSSTGSVIMTATSAAALSNGSGEDVTIVSGSGDGIGTGGNINLVTGEGNLPGQVRLTNSVGAELKVQDPVSGPGPYLSMEAANAALSSGSDGGDIFLVPGTGDGVGTDGAIIMSGETVHLLGSTSLTQSNVDTEGGIVSVGKARDNVGAEDPIQTGDVMGYYTFDGYAGGDYAISSFISSTATENFATTFGSTMSIATTLNGSATPSNVVEFNDLGLDILGRNAAPSALRLESDETSGIFLGLLANDGMGSSYSLTFPTTFGSANEVLTSDGLGGLFWSTPGTSGFTSTIGETANQNVIFGSLTSPYIPGTGQNQLAVVAASDKAFLSASSFGGLGSEVRLSSSGGTSGGQLATAANNLIGEIVFEGYETGTPTYHFGASMRVSATEAWTTTERGTRMSFAITPSTTTSLENKMIIENNDVGFTSQGAGAETELRFYDNTLSEYVGFKIDDSQTLNNVTWTLPNADGTANQVLATNGSGALSWANPAGFSLPITDNQFNIFDFSGDKVITNNISSSFVYETTNLGTGIILEQSGRLSLYSWPSQTNGTSLTPSNYNARLSLAGTGAIVNGDTPAAGVSLDVRSAGVNTAPDLLVYDDGGDTNSDASTTFRSNNGTLTTNFSVGVDADANQNFVISESTTLGTNDRLFIERSTGEVGIGTNSPAAALDVNGDIAASGFRGSLSSFDGDGFVASTRNIYLNVETGAGFYTEINGGVDGEEIVIIANQPGVIIVDADNGGSNLQLANNRSLNLNQFSTLTLVYRTGFWYEVSNSVSAKFRGVRQVTGDMTVGDFEELIYVPNAVGDINITLPSAGANQIGREITFISQQAVPNRTNIATSGSIVTDQGTINNFDIAYRSGFLFSVKLVQVAADTWVMTENKTLP